MSTRKDSDVDAENKQLKRKNETLELENAELRERIDELERSLVDEALERSGRHPRGQRSTNSDSEESSETAASGSNAGELQRQLNDAIKQLSETRKQLLNVQDQLTVGKQVTAATQRRQAGLAGLRECYLSNSFIHPIPTPPHVIAALKVPWHPGCTVLFLPRDASAERGNATVSRPSVCLSVRPSVCDV